MQRVAQFNGRGQMSSELSVCLGVPCPVPSLCAFVSVCCSLPPCFRAGGGFCAGGGAASFWVWSVWSAWKGVVGPVCGQGGRRCPDGGRLVRRDSLARCGLVRRTGVVRVARSLSEEVILVPQE
jgi:hypothetical protein